jgi:hypothetical protein
MGEGSAVSCDDVHAHQFLIGGLYQKEGNSGCFGSAFFFGKNMKTEKYFGGAREGYAAAVVERRRSGEPPNKRNVR